MRLLAVILQIFADVSHQMVLFAGSCDDVNLRQRRDFLRFDLRVTPGHRDNGLRTLFFHAADILPRLAVREVRHSAGIDDINVRRVFFAGNLVSGVAKLFLHGFGFVLVDLAAQCMKCSLHRAPPSRSLRAQSALQ